MHVLAKIYQNPLLTDQDLQRIYEAHQLVQIQKGDFLSTKGKISSAYYVVASGLIRSYVYDLDGNEITTDFIKANELAIDVVSLFTQVPAVEYIQAETDAVCYKINLQHFQGLYHSIAGLSEWGRAWMSENLFKQKLRSISMITESASTRYEQLMNLHPEVIQQAPLKHIASYLGITDTSLSRIRKEQFLIK